MTQAQAVKYWLKSAEKNIKVAEDTFKAGHYDWCLFFWQLAIEKTLKGLIAKRGLTPPPIHNLNQLAGIAGLKLDEKRKKELNLPGGVSMAAKISLNPAVVSQIKHYQLSLKKAGIKSKLIIFGSQAKGKAKPWSDIDVCVVSDSFGKNRHTERVKLMYLTDEMTLNIEPHPYNPRDLVDKWDSLAHEIRKYGISWQEVAP